jgi:transcriptional regulator with XRE-family HTH domain
MKEEKTYIIRKHLKLDQKAFASKLGLSQSAISQFENGTRVVSKELYKRIADVFKIDIDSAIEQFKSKNIEKQAAEEINEKVRIVKILAETTLSVDTNIYLQEIANIVIGDSKLLRAALSKFDYLKKRDMLKSNYVFRYDIEVKCDLAFPTIEEYHKYVD